MGPESSATRLALMDAVEAVMREDGYAALSARSVARRAGLKYQIVFYYFSTMDDLLLTTYRRRTQQVLERIEEALQSDQPLHAFWAAWSDPHDAALTLEYMAMANHNEAIRAETIAFGERVRRVELGRISERLREASPDPEAFQPFAITRAIASIGAILGFETALGISGGHRETQALVEWCLRHLEADPSASKPVRALP
jgi:AcrR family transcriptional regulator